MSGVFVVFGFWATTNGQLLYHVAWDKAGLELAVSRVVGDGGTVAALHQFPRSEVGPSIQGFATRQYATG